MSRKIKNDFGLKPAKPGHNRELSDRDMDIAK
jgi:hypothetical protein